MKSTDITREEIAELVAEAHSQGKNREDHVKQRLKFNHPGFEGLTVVRNGQVYNVIDYLTEDLESYGPPA